MLVSPRNAEAAHPRVLRASTGRDLASKAVALSRRLRAGWPSPAVQAQGGSAASSLAELLEHKACPCRTGGTPRSRAGCDRGMPRKAYQSGADGGIFCWVDNGIIIIACAGRGWRGMGSMPSTSACARMLGAATAFGLPPRGRLPPRALRCPQQQATTVGEEFVSLICACMNKRYNSMKHSI